MIGLFCFALTVLGSPFKSKLRLEAENAVLRHQMIVLKRRLHGRVRLTDQDRWFLICIAGLPQSCRFLQSSGPRRWCGGTGPASPLLALEVAPSGRAATNRSGAARVDPADEPRKSAMGRAAHSRGATQART